MIETIGCSHEWVPADSMIAWRCRRCLRERDGMPQDGPDPLVKVIRWVVKRVLGSPV